MNNLTKGIYGFLIVLLATTATFYIALQGSNVLMKITKTSSTFYINESGVLSIAGVENVYLYNGSKKLAATYKADLSSINNDGVISLTKKTSYNNILIKEIYTYDSKLTNVESFPIAHTIEVFNASELILDYEVSKLTYTGIARTANSPESFGKNMKVEWSDGAYFEKITKPSTGGKLQVKYKILSDYEIYNVRLFDPLVPATQCYQESANTFNQTGIDDSCNLVYNGTYGSGDYYIYMNYTKPVNASNESLWYVKHGSTNHPDTGNYTIPSTCWSYASVLNFRFYSYPGPKDSVGQCYNGTLWLNVTNFTHSTDTGSGSGGYLAAAYDGDWSTCTFNNGASTWGGGTFACSDAEAASKVYEEAMWWQIGNATYTYNLSLNGLSKNIVVELGSVINISDDYGTGTTCIDFNHPAYGTNYSCGTNITSFNANVTWFRTTTLSDSNISENKTFKIPFYCYQESTNVSNQTGIDGSCGLNYTGNYIDKTVVSGSDEYYYFLANYTKPPNTTNNSLWTFKSEYYITTVYSVFYNVEQVIPSTCWNAYPNNFIAGITTNNLGNIIDFVCDNGVTYTSIYNSFDKGENGTSTNSSYLYDGNWNTGLQKFESNYVAKNSSGYGFVFYEEAMKWEILNSPSIINSTNFSIYTHKYDEPANLSFNVKGYVGDNATYPTNVKLYINGTYVKTIGDVFSSSNLTLSTFSDASTSKNSTFNSDSLSIIGYLKLPKTANITSNLTFNITGSNRTVVENMTLMYDTFIDKLNPDISDFFSNSPSTLTYFESQESGSSFEKIPLLKFDSNIPVNSTINNGTLHLFVWYSGIDFAASNDTINVSQITGIWDSGWSWNKGIPTHNSTFESGNKIPCIGLPHCPILISTGYEVNWSVKNMLQQISSASSAELSILLNDSVVQGTSNGVTFYSNENSLTQYRPYLEVNYTTTIPKDVWLEVGIINGIREWNYTGTYNISQITNINSSIISDYLSSCTADISGFCNIPIYISSSTPGTININNISMNYTYVNDVVINVSYIVFNNSNLSLVFTSDTNGIIQISDIKYDYRGGNKTYNVLAHDVNYTINQSYNITYYHSRWDYVLPNAIEYIDFFPASPTSKNVTPFGQTNTKPILNITSYAYSNNFNYSIRMDSGLSCVNLTLSTNSSKTNGIIVTNSSWTEYINNMTYLNYTGIWMWADYGCSPTYWQLFQPNFYFRACVVNADICSTELS